jgi:archaellum biogenesis ATPase FlaH
MYDINKELDNALQSENLSSRTVINIMPKESLTLDVDFSEVSSSIEDSLVNVKNSESLPTKKSRLPLPVVTESRRFKSHAPQNSKRDRWSPEDCTNYRLEVAKVKKAVWTLDSSLINDQKKEKQGITLSSPVPFSTGFKEALGIENTVHIQGIDDERLAISIFEGYLEQVAYEYPQQKNKQLCSILNYAAIDLRISIQKKSSTFLWRERDGTLWNTGVVQLIQHVFTIPRMDAIATLASILNFEFNNLFTVHNTHYVAELKNHSITDKSIPEHLHIRSKTPHKQIAMLADVAAVHGNSGQEIGAFCTYELGRLRFCLPATVVRGQLCIGKHNAPAFLLNQDKIDRHPFATVFLCQDIRLAIALDKRIHESPNLSDSEVIVTGHMGRDLSPIPWNYLAGHDVILLCAPDKECHAQVKAYQNHVAKAGAQSFRVYPFPVLWSKVEKMDGSDAGLISEIEQVLFDKAVALASMAASDLITKLQCEARSYDNYVAWGKKKGLFQSTECHRHDNRDAPTLFSCVTEDCALPHSTTPSLNSLFPKGSISLLHGKKNSGKSFTLLSLAKALCSGSSFHNFECAGAPCKCLLLDSETQPLLLDSRLKQMKLDAHIGTNLHVISKRHEPGGSLWADFDLTRQEHLDALLTHVRDSNIEYVFLDNLTTLVPSGATYQQNTAGLVFDGLKKLCELGVGVILVHHTLDDPGRKGVHGKMRGSSEFSIRCHTETMVIGKEEVLKEGNAPAVIMERTQQDGALSGLYVKSCKTAAHLENKIFWQHLPLNKSEWQFIATTDITGEIVEESDHAAKKGAERQSSPQTVPDIGAEDAGQVSTHDDTPADTTTLSPREERALAFVRTQKKVTRKQVQSHLAVAEKTAGNTLKVLLKAKLIKKSGSNGDKNTYYYVD